MKISDSTLNLTGQASAAQTNQLVTNLPSLGRPPSPPPSLSGFANLYRTIQGEITAASQKTTTNLETIFNRPQYFESTESLTDLLAQRFPMKGQNQESYQPFPASIEKWSSFSYFLEYKQQAFAHTNIFSNFQQASHSIFSLWQSSVATTNNQLQNIMTSSMKSTSENLSLNLASRQSTNLWQQLMTSQDMSFRADGQVKTSTGKTIDLDFDLSYFQLNTASNQFGVINAPLNFIDPLALDLDGKGLNFSKESWEFDLDCDGVCEELPQFSAGSGYLVYDKNKDGLINNGSEMFGALSGDGYADLSYYDLDNNNWLDENDSIYNDLKIWSNDEDGTAIYQTLQEANIGAINLSSVSTPFIITNDENKPLAEIAKTGLYLTEDGDVKATHQVNLVVAKPQDPKTSDTTEQAPDQASDQTTEQEQVLT